jgi:hypothetical protein
MKRSILLTIGTLPALAAALAARLAFVSRSVLVIGRFVGDTPDGFEPLPGGHGRAETV